MHQTSKAGVGVRAFARGCLGFAVLAFAAFAGAAQAQLPNPVFRFYNTATGTHFYTISTPERDLVLSRYPHFAYEGPAYYAHPAPTAGNLPVYRFYNTRTGTHFYTQSEEEKNFVLATWPVFAFEGPAYYAPAAAGAGRVPLYRFYNTNTGAHFFTTNAAERDMVLQRWPFFAYEGTAYQVYPTGATGGNIAPIAKLSVTPTTVPVVPAIVTLSVDTSDTDGQVVRVEFYAGAAKVGETVVAPHTMNYPVTVAGMVAFRAIAFDNLNAATTTTTVNVQAGPVSVNVPPKVTLSASPATLPGPGTVSLAASATDDDGSIAKVTFYEGNNKLGEVTSAPFAIAYNAATARLYKFRAVAVDDDGASTTSTEIGVTVGTLTNVAPKVTLSVSPSSQAAPGPLTLTATASDDDGTVAKVEFYQGGTKIAEKTAAPWTASFTTTATAIYKFSARATDDKGATTTSADVNVSVGNATNIAPKVSLAVSGTQIPFPGTVTLTATASDDDGTITRVSFYQNGTKRADVTTPPYTFDYTTTVPGVYKFRAVAVDNKNASTSTAEIDVTSGTAIQLNKKPAVSLSLSNTLVMAPATITLTVSASDTDGTIAKVQFYRNGAKLGEKTATPFTWTDTVASPGQVTYHADAVDDVGNVNTTLGQVVSAQTPPPSAPRSADVWRLLNQATFGASQGEAANVVSKGVTGWIDDQFVKPMSGYPATRYNRIQLSETADCTTRDPLGGSYPGNSPQSTCVRDHLSLQMMQRDLFTHAAFGADQLRQRVAWALSQILVISGVEADLSRAHVMARYQQIMFENAFGNYETILKKISVSPAMGNWLDSVNNDRPNPTTGKVPNENYAREIKQLFSIGLHELKADGTPLLDAFGDPIPTYDQDDIKQFARVFTGWTYANPDGSAITKKNGVYYGADMGVYPGTATTGHDPDAKTLLNGTVLPAGQTPQKDMDDAVHNVFVHPNTGPFIGKQLIQRLVTGNPSPAYVGRVAAIFNNNGAGVRGDLKAVVRAILLDSEARGPTKADPGFGTLREPVLMITGLVRALNGVTDGTALGDRASTLGQRPYYSPTVFNYFQPDETVPGTSILAPEFGIHNSNSAVARTNLVYSLVYSGIAPDGNLANATGTRLNTFQFDPFATDAALLTDKVSEALLGGPLPPASRDAVIAAVNAVVLSATPTQAQLTDRSRAAVYLIASSFHYQVQR
ncbi:Chitodextrinase [Burkholderiales bacterium]|nr:Chitodextrinase [Burkholderiales bacterium]